MSFLSENSDSLQWPEGVEELFRQDFSGAEAYLHHMIGLGLYADCYKTAADVLVGAAANDQFKTDTLVYPIVFLYRHYLELSLKEILRYGGRLTGKRRDKNDNHHRLDTLWKACVPLIFEVWPDTDMKEMAVVESCINEFMRYDPASFAFRYPTAKDGSPSLSPDLRYIDVVNLSEVMQKLANYLDGAVSGIMDAGNALPDLP